MDRFHKLAGRLSAAATGDTAERLKEAARKIADRPTTASSSGDGVDDGSAWVRQALGRTPTPASPIEQLWEFGLAAIVRPHLPAVLRPVPGLLDRLGTVALDHRTLAIDTTRVNWSDVTEIRARPLPDVLSSGTIEAISDAVTQLLPISRLAKRPARWLTDKISDVVLSLFLVALVDRGDHLVPAEIVHRGRIGRITTTRPGIVATAVLAIPTVADSVLATARVNGATIVSPPADGRDLDAARARRTDLETRIARLRAALTPEADDDLAAARPDEVDPLSHS